MTAQSDGHPATHSREWHSHEPSTEADRIWRAIEMISDRQASHDEQDRAFHGQLPELMMQAVADGIRIVVQDQGQRDAFWQSGVEHIGSLMKRQAGGTVLGLLWSACKLAAVALLVLVTFGPASVKALLLGWWKP